MALFALITCMYTFPPPISSFPPPPLPNYKPCPSPPTSAPPCPKPYPFPPSLPSPTTSCPLQFPVLYMLYTTLEVPKHELTPPPSPPNSAPNCSELTADGCGHYDANSGIDDLKTVNPTPLTGGSCANANMDKRIKSFRCKAMGAA